jgi:O-antigen/teichoic acid export membrane protein
MAKGGTGLAATGSRGVAKTLIYQLGGQALTIGATAVVARKLGPHPYGLLGFALLIGLPLAGIADLGLGQALMRAPAQTREMLDSAFWVTLGGSATAIAAAVPLSLLLAARYGVAGSGWIVAVGATGILLAVPAAAPRAALARTFKFGKLAASDFLGQVASGAAMLGLALGGAGAWALVVGLGARSLVAFIGASVFARFIPHRTFRRSALEALWPFGLRAAASGTLSYIARNIDDLLVARFLGATVLGLYRVGFGVALLPFSYLGVAIGNVVLPTFGAINDDRDRVRLGFLRATRALAYLNTGITLLLWWLAALAINLLYGSSFTDSVPFLRILCLAALLYPLGALSGSVMLALGRADLELRLTALRAVATGGFAYAGWKIDGAHGIAWGVSAYAVVMSALDVLVTGWLVRARLRDLTRTFLPSVVVGGSLFAALVALEQAAHPSSGLRLVVTAVAAVLYVVGGLWVDRDLLGAIVPSLRSSGAAPALVLEEHGNPD